MRILELIGIDGPSISFSCAGDGRGADVSFKVLPDTDYLTSLCGYQPYTVYFGHPRCVVIYHD